MAKTLYVSEDNLSDEAKKIIVPLGGLSKYAVKGYCSVGGLSKLFWGDDVQEGWRQEANIPYSFANGSAVVYQNKIHLLGGSSSQTSHYSWDGTTWVQESTMPFSYYNGSAIVADGKIHCFGGNNAGSRYYTWDGTSWTQQPNLPDEWPNPWLHRWVELIGINHAVIFNNKITLAGSNSNSNDLFKRVSTLNNGSWSVNWDALNQVFYSASSYDGKIYMIGDSGTSGTKYYIWNGSALSSGGTIPTNFTTGYALEYKGNIHLLGCSNNKHYAFDGTTFTAKDDIPYNGFANCPAVVFNNKIHIFGNNTNHWSYSE